VTGGADPQLLTIPPSSKKKRQLVLPLPLRLRLPLLGVIITEAAVAPLRQLLAAGSRAPVVCL
jgi:hypothetical protein